MVAHTENIRKGVRKYVLKRTEALMTFIRRNRNCILDNLSVLNSLSHPSRLIVQVISAVSLILSTSDFFGYH